MRILEASNNCQLTYCLNIHRGETLEEQARAIEEHAVAVRNRLAVTEAFGLGLRFGIESLRELEEVDQTAAFGGMLSELNLYGFTINGFPYGQFHETRVKESVYAPDWRSNDRRDYTLGLANVLAELLPPDTEGSISTVPCSFQPWIKTEQDVEQMVQMLVEVVLHLHQIQDTQGVLIHLGLEPEPACYLETSDEFIRFFNDQMLMQGRRLLAKELKNPEEVLRRHLGINFDCCHLAIQYENLTDSLRRFVSEGILLSKVHLSAALDVSDPRHFSQLASFDEPVYLHQVKAKTARGDLLHFVDLPEALAALPAASDIESARVHFHVPLFWPGDAEGLSTTATCMDDRFWELLAGGICPHLEIETYTFDVLPESLRPPTVVDCIVSEYEWVLNKLKQAVGD